MSRVAKLGVKIPEKVEVNIQGTTVNVKGSKGTLEKTFNSSVKIEKKDSFLSFSPATEDAVWAQAGTARSIVNSMVIGVVDGFEKKLDLVGVGYRAAVAGKKLNLVLGFSHPVEYAIPEGIVIQTPTNTEVVISGADKQVVGQVAAHIRSFRPPEPYKGKGVKYSDEMIIRKEAKKA